jgi:multidrug resistance efflux pump
MSQLFSHVSIKSIRPRLGVTLATAVALLGIGLGVSALQVQAHGASTPVAASQVPAQSGETVASGFIEADEVSIASELGGRILALPVPEGADAQMQDVLVQLDHGMADAELRVAQSKVQAAGAALAKVKAGARVEEIQQAEAAGALAEANVKAANQSRQDAQMLLTQQQSLDLQITQAGTQAEVARNQLSAASSNQTAVQTVYDHTSEDDRKKGLKDYDIWQSWISVNSAQASYDGALATLQKLQEERQSSVALRAQVDSAESAYNAAQVGVSQAQARLTDLKAGATPEQIAIAEAQVHAANATAQAAEAKQKKLTLYAPVNGQVIAHNLKVGELASPGATILTLANLDTLSLVVYVPADKLGLVQLGAKVSVQVDGYPGRTFEGEVIHIADKADFVPDNVQSEEDRASMVFEVKLRIANSDHALKPGLPADAHFQGK